MAAMRIIDSIPMRAIDVALLLSLVLAGATLAKVYHNAVSGHYGPQECRLIDGADQHQERQIWP